MITRQQIIEEARSWVGTPFHHQASVKGRGCDCGGMIKGVGAVFGCNFKRVPVDYARIPSNGMLEALLEDVLVPTPVPHPGDVLLFKYLREPQHLGIFTEKDSVIHSYQPSGRVIEHRLDKKWRSRIVRVFKYPGVID